MGVDNTTCRWLGLKSLVLLAESLDDGSEVFNRSSLSLGSQYSNDIASDSIRDP